MLTLYTYPITTNALKLSLLLAYIKPHAALDIALKEVKIHQREQHSDAFLTLNPKAKIPVLVNQDTGQVITESNAILLYITQLEQVQNVQALAGLGQQSELMSWLFWQASDTGIGQSGFHFNRILLSAWGIKRPYEPDEKSLAKFHQSCQLLDQHLAKQTYLCGVQLTIADMAIAAPMMFYKECQMPINDYPYLLAWLVALESTTWWRSVKEEADVFIKNMPND